MYPSGSERGYLLEHFRLFHTIDQNEVKVDWHFHAFDKLIFFLSGHADYTVESETTHLVPGDMMVIARGQLHKMHAFSDVPYDRFILYLDSAFLTSLAPDEGGLNACFQRARKSGVSLLRLSDADRGAVYSLLTRLEKEIKDPSPFSTALSKALLTELLIFICRADPSAKAPAPAETADDKIAAALDYIQDHLGEDLSCSTLAAQFYMSRSSFQHRFKDATGCPPHAYIRLKRLLYASELLSNGEPALQVGKKCGYTDHSAFCHAFTAQFGVAPSAFRPLAMLAGPEE